MRDTTPLNEGLLYYSWPSQADCSFSRASPRPAHSEAIRVCHIALGDLWAGTEVHLATLLSHLVKIPDLYFSAILFNEGRLADELKHLGIKVTVISESTHSSAHIFSRLLEHLRNDTPDIIHTHKYKDNILGGLAGKLVGVPYMVRIVHGLSEPFSGVENARMAIYEFLDRLMNKYVNNKLIAVSSNIKSVLERKYDPDKVVCIHNGIDLQKLRVKKSNFEKRRELGIADNFHIIGTVGRLTSVKGHEYLLRAASLLLKRGHVFKLLFVGDGPSKGKLKDVANQLGIEEHVIFAGHQQEVYEYMNVMDVFVLPSLHEGMPMVLLEALALGRPVVASRVGGIPEVIQDRVTGFLVAPGNSEDLAHTIGVLLDDQHLAERLGKVGRGHVEESFSARRMAQQVAQVYQALVHDGGRR